MEMNLIKDFLCLLKKIVINFIIFSVLEDVKIFFKDVCVMEKSNDVLVLREFSEDWEF